MSNDFTTILHSSVYSSKEIIIIIDNFRWTNSKVSPLTEKKPKSLNDALLVFIRCLKTLTQISSIFTFPPILGPALWVWIWIKQLNWFRCCLLFLFETSFQLRVIKDISKESCFINQSRVQYFVATRFSDKKCVLHE